MKLKKSLLNNEARQKMLWERDRRLDKNHDPYTPDELTEMFGPYLAEFSHEGLSPREVRLLETIIDSWYNMPRECEESCEARS